MNVELSREQSKSKNGTVYNNWVIVVNGIKVPIKPLFNNGYETLIEEYLKEKGGSK